MTYALLLWPHANWRYEEAARQPAQAELDIILSAAGISETCAYAPLQGADALLIHTDALLPWQLEAISRHSLLYWFGIWNENRAFLPLFGAPHAYLGSDLAAIQKYKGKTNERFTQMLINTALFSTGFHGEAGRLSLLDPMCGRGTTLFQAVNRGWNAYGLDADKKDVGECALFFEKYLQYTRVKHKRAQASQTIPGSAPVKLDRFQFALAAEEEPHALTVAAADAALAAKTYGRGAFHVICCDLPYGVQHAPSGQGGQMSFENTLLRALPAWKAALKPGGAISLSFNTHTLKTERVLDLMDACGLRALRGGAYARMAHWVEQAVTRDIAVCVNLK